MPRSNDPNLAQFLTRKDWAKREEALTRAIFPLRDLDSNERALAQSWLQASLTAGAGGLAVRLTWPRLYWGAAPIVERTVSDDPAWHPLAAQAVAHEVGTGNVVFYDYDLGVSGDYYYRLCRPDGAVISRIVGVTVELLPVSTCSAPSASQEETSCVAAPPLLRKRWRRVLELKEILE